jgi:hypothetical protein
MTFFPLSLKVLATTLVIAALAWGAVVREQCCGCMLVLTTCSNARKAVQDFLKKGHKVDYTGQEARRHL